VSVVTPSLNQARYLEAAIRSVAEQDYPRLEHVVVDAGSTDGTVEILHRHPNLRWVSEPDEGQADAINKGFRLAGGTIFGWLNADDVYLPGAVSRAVEELVATGCGLVHGAWRQIDESGATIRDVEVVPFTLRDLLDRYNPVAQPAAFFTRAAFEAVGGLDPRLHYAMDYDLWVKIAARFEVRTIPDRLAAFRFHDEAKTAAHADAFWPEVRRVSRAHGGRFFSPMAVERWCRRYPALWRLRMTYRLVRAGDGAQIGRALAGKVGRRQ
jgi:glycosyltransferase involved in cell wall biosynthesis